MPDNQIRDIVIYSDEMQDVVGEVPSWIIRSGISMLFIVILSFLVGSWFFKYPDIMISNIIITTKNPTVFLIANSDGNLEKLYVKNNQIVEKDQIIAMIGNNTDYNSIHELKSSLIKMAKSFNDDDLTELLTFKINPNLNLGKLQEPYEYFKKKFEHFKQFNDLEYHHRKKIRIQEELNKNKAIVGKNKNSISLSERELVLKNNKLSRAKELFKQGLISKESLETQEAEYLQKRNDLENANANLIGIELQDSQLNRSLFELDIEFKEKNKHNILELKESHKNLFSKIFQWEKSYLIRSTISGQVSFTTYWSENQYVKSGERIFAIVPSETSKIIGKVTLPIKGSGKVKIGHKVNIKFENYPYTEFGIVKGVIVSKSLIPENNQYILEVALPNGLLTNYQKELGYHPEMKGIAEIITEDTRLLERFFNPIKSVLSK
ncbi:MAG: HlyD family efflux transporter periplasmic adaptor subunit [Acidobacteriota bacterium]